MAENKKNTSGRGSVGWRLYAFYILMLFAAVFVLVRIVFLQLTFKPDPEVAKVFRPSTHCEEVQAARGNILSCDGRMLAITYPEYTLYIDCTVQADTIWNKHLDSLCMGLSAIFNDKSAAEYKSILQKGRKEHSKYVKIGSRFDLKTLRELEKLPILSKGRYKGGMVTETRNARHYPYGTLGRRTIGFVRDPGAQVKNTHIGLEGKFDYVLHGRNGKMWLRESDDGLVQNFDSTYVKPEDGMDLRTTLNIDYQSIADEALREGIADDQEIEGGCVILMDVKTGAIRAMVNLLRDPQDGYALKESENLAIRRKGEPGSVFKSTCLMIMLENGFIKSLDETIPSNHGVVKGFHYEPDVHITQYESAHHTDRIPIIEGFKVSSNYMFRYLAHTHYARDPKKYISHLYTYKLGEAFDFDLSGLASPVLPNPDSPAWSASDLLGLATGYVVDETPLHLLTFYNAIAGKGNMMKPYLVEDIERHGEVVTERGPSILNASICSKATADTMTRALIAVTEEGTAKRLKGAKCTVAGKTGTSRVALQSGGYFKDGKKKNQGTFVGFFPARDPQYSVICVIYSYLSNKSFYGGTIPAAVVRKIVDQVYDIDPYWQTSVKEGAKMTTMRSDAVIGARASGSSEVKVPSVLGMGLKDAIFLLENSGLECSYSGIGHVVSQEPSAGTKAFRGKKVKIVLQ